MTKKRFRSLLLLGLVLFAGCDSDRLKQFSDLAAAGSAFSAAESALTAELSSAFLNATGTSLARTKNSVQGTPFATLDKALKDANAEDKQYLTNLSLINQQSAILGAYFAKMSQLADSKNSDAVVASANTLLQQLNNVNTSLTNSLPVSNGVTVAETLNKDVTPLIVAHFQVRALDKDLQMHADTINKSLALHQIAVGYMATHLQQSLSTLATYTEDVKVTSPFTANTPLKDPNSWIQDRTTILQTQANLSKAQAAKDAIQKLRTAFQDVVSNKGARVDFTDLLNSITQMTGYISDVKTALSANATQNTNSTNSGSASSH